MSPSERGSPAAAGCDGGGCVGAAHATRPSTIPSVAIVRRRAVIGSSSRSEESRRGRDDTLTHPGGVMKGLVLFAAGLVVGALVTHTVSAQGSAPRALSHVGIAVKDFDAAMAYYTKTVGLREAYS